MSLISEALRKARQEAAQREGEERGVVSLSAPARGVQRRSRLGAGLLIGALIGVGAAIVGGALVWWALASRAPAGVVGDSGDADAPIPASSAARDDEVVDSEGETDRDDPAPETVTETATEMNPAAAPTSLPLTRARGPADPGTDHPERATIEAVSTDADPASSPDRAADGTGAPGDRVFVLDADLGYATLSLGFIVYKPSDPFAEVNGQEVRVGTLVDGFIVEEIERGHVRLRDNRGAVVLRVR